MEHEERDGHPCQFSLCSFQDLLHSKIAPVQHLENGVFSLIFENHKRNSQDRLGLTKII